MIELDPIEKAFSDAFNRHLADIDIEDDKAARQEAANEAMSELVDRIYELEQKYSGR